MLDTKVHHIRFCSLCILKRALGQLVENISLVLSFYLVEVIHVHAQAGGSDEHKQLSTGSSLVGGHGRYIHVRCCYVPIVNDPKIHLRKRGKLVPFPSFVTPCNVTRAFKKAPGDKTVK